MAGGAAAMAQLNVRINAEAKAAGDLTLDRAGITATELVRAVWETLGRGKGALRGLVLAMDAARIGEVKRLSATEDKGLVARIKGRQAAFEREFGLDPATYVPISDEELSELVYLDRLEEEREEALRYAH